MLTFFFYDFLCFFPEIFLSVSSCLFFIFFSFFSVRPVDTVKKIPSIGPVAYYQILLFLGLFFLLCVNIPGQGGFFLYSTLIFDSIGFFSKLWVILCSFFVFFISFSYIKKESLLTFEFYGLVLFGFLGLVFLISSADLITLYIALELQSLVFYILASFKKNSAFSTEAGVKYAVIGAFSSGIFLFGCSLIYGFTGTTSYSDFWFLYSIANQMQIPLILYLGFSLITVTFFFKIVVAPFHLWAVDVYEGSPLAISVFFSVVPKIALSIGLIRFFFYCFFYLCYFWSSFLVFISFLCFAFGVFGAFSQRKVKRFFIFSSINHFGFFMSALACCNFYGLQAFFLYGCIYTIISFWLWGALLFFTKNSKPIFFLDEFLFLPKDNPIFAFSLALVVFSIAGIPPLGGFFAKFSVFFALASSSFYFCLFFIVFFASLSCFYYLRVLKIIFFNKSLFLNPCFSKIYSSSFSYIEAVIFSIGLVFLSFIFYNPGILYLVTHQISCFLLG